MKKLAIVCGSLARGGAERVSIYLAQYMHEKGIKCSLITMKRAKIEYAVPKGVNRINAADLSFNIFISLRRAYNMCGCDTILIMSVSNCLYAIPPLIGLGKKVIVSERNSPMNFVGRKSVRYIARWLMRYADGYVFQTEEAKRFYDKSLNGCGIVIPNPLIIDNMPAPYTGVREKRIVTVGRLKPQKNQRMLIEAFALIHHNYPDYTLEIYGEGVLHQELLNIIDSEKLSNIVFLRGNVESVFQRILKAAVFVMSSDYEGMPNALIEAMALGLPCISTDCPCGGPRYLINSGVNGLLCKVNDVESLKMALISMLDEPQKAIEMGIKAINVRNILDAKKIGDYWYNYMNSFK